VRVIVVGAGQVGSNIAADLAATHEVVVVDLDGDRVESLAYREDVLGVEGDGTDLDDLREAGIDEADILVASTDSDEANIVACGTAKTVQGGDVFTIARVRRTPLLRTWEASEGAFGVDHMVSVDLLAARSIVRIAGIPGARDVDSFADGRVRMAEFDVTEESPVANLTVSEADRYEGLTFAAILRDGSVTIPRGDTAIRPGDDLVVIGLTDACRSFASALAGEGALDRDADVVVVGGGEVGYQTTRLFEDSGFSPRLVERDPERARELAERLPGTVVMGHDATDMEFLDREHVGDADLVVGALSEDERNLLVCLLAARLGAARTVAVVEDGAYVDLFEAVGVDVAVNPREATAEEITRFTREERSENVAIVETGRAEVIEIVVDDESALAGRTIRESIADLPSGVVIGAITRGEDEFVTPRGDTTIRVDDHVVAFVDGDVLDEVAPQL
jgi:trk system potassium uptake protein TrkA